MKFLLYLLLGYSVWEIDTGDLRALLNFCNRSGVRLRRIREGETTVRIWVLLADEAKLMDFAARRGCDLRICVRHGLLSSLSLSRPSGVETTVMLNGEFLFGVGTTEIKTISQI